MERQRACRHLEKKRCRATESKARLLLFGGFRSTTPIEDNRIVDYELQGHASRVGKKRPALITSSRMDILIEPKMD